MGKVHGSLARAGKVKGQTPKVAPQEGKDKKLSGRARMRYLFNSRYASLKEGQDPLRVKLNSQEKQQGERERRATQKAQIEANKH